MESTIEPKAETESDPATFWLIAELFGHKRIAGRAREVLIAGTKFLQIDVPENEGDGFKRPQVLSPKAFYGLSPVDEETARAAARIIDWQPPMSWELKALAAGNGTEDDSDEPPDETGDEDLGF